jgi:hypothetical protein
MRLMLAAFVTFWVHGADAQQSHGPTQRGHVDPSHARAHGETGAADGHAKPYAGFQNRPIKPLSFEQIADLRAGRGMAFALAAELNGYPGPMHVLEHADALKLDADQRRTMDRLLQEMRRDAVIAGEALIAAEAGLDQIFASGVADNAGLAEHIRRAASAQGEVRRVHLAAHIATRQALSASQIALYDRLRGYAPN